MERTIVAVYYSHNAWHQLYPNKVHKLQKLANKVTSYRVKPQTQQIHGSSMKKQECNMEKYCPI